MKTNEEEKKGFWQKWKKPILGISTGVLIGAAWYLKQKNNSLREENIKLKGINENLEDQNKGQLKAIEKLSYFLGKHRKY